jgi:hypothetical protein
VGAPKSGTTSLFRYLIQHPSVFVPIKEPQFLADFRSPSAPRDLDEYLSLYDSCPAGARTGDLSSWYLPSVHAARKIHALNPAARIAMILRNPVDRAYSHYWYRRTIHRPKATPDPGMEDLSFEDALEAEAQRIRDGCGVGFRYVTTGLYAEQVVRYLELFPSDRVRIYLFEDLVRDPHALIRDFFAFLGVDPDHPVSTDKAFNRSVSERSRVLAQMMRGPFPGRSLLKRVLGGRSSRLKTSLERLNEHRPPAMRPETAGRLIDRFRPDIERLQRILDRDLSDWLSASSR